jgi:archaellum component FlaC
MKNFRDEIYNIVEEYLVNQTPRLQNNVDEGQKKLISELINRIDDLDKKVEDLQPKIHLTNAKSEKVEKLRMDRLKSAP